MLERMKNPLFIAAAASLVYQVLEKYGYAPTFDDYQMAVDLVSYLLIGVGVYSQFTPKDGQDDKSTNVHQ